MVEWTGMMWVKKWTGDGALVNVVANFRLPQNAGNYLTIWETASHEGVCCTETFKNSWR